MSALWTSEAFVAATGGRTVGRVPDIRGISIDSRTLDPGDAFFAIRGDRFDGHDFVTAAIAHGAVVAVIDEQHAAALSGAGAALVVVPDVLEALRRLGMAARRRTGARIIGVTGSVGKTGTKEALRLALSRSGRTHASAASYNNHWGVPLSLARMPEATRFGVFEMGMNAPGEISALTRMVRPQIAIITTVEPVHLEFFGSVEKIADAKAEIFEGLEADGTAILNLDNPHFARLADAARAHGARVVTFGAAATADVRLVRVALHPDCSCVTAELFGREVTYKLGAPGRHLVGNSLAVLAAVDMAGADLALAALALADLRAPKGRGARFRLKVGEGTITVIDESYNANPASMRAALALLGQTQPGPRGRRIAVIGDMRELGAAADDLHRALAVPLAEAGVDLLLGAGPHTRALYEAVDHRHRHVWALESEGLRDELLDLVRPGDVVMIKGSLGSRMGPLVEALRQRFAPVEQGAA
ncbi:UDP-N-acetylmuramoyl-tripeptide--D-alanyl-D-alanine ligase [Tepidamorphus gemmatus]|uniref:UDP-N-acetylmuramoyl-tripeptide--D-alanyl-D-alanine ligase n=1 Tax=Tepidamorphus gemmatus TaxID=747076 RepID=A0A4R3ML44_9HYPH|nr:UDP-N-acetylmuramoylalanyl-D-glutamyl-2,6-diaminopimelate--D-alanyl-D-alanine ligase [Tepidamorphus gemmatus]TCT13498.1 UDP-N-acetylmuramoyl-tripeptide--D-alanyl-D-alanine ligase [Tepidamorphus gemmatus]